MKLLACSLLCLAAFAQTRPAASKPTVDKTKLEAYLRYLELWVPDVNVKIDDPKPVTGMPGFNSVAVHFSYKQASMDLNYYVSDDSSRFLRETYTIFLGVQGGSHYIGPCREIDFIPNSGLLPTPRAPIAPAALRDRRRPPVDFHLRELTVPTVIVPSGI